MTRVVLLHPGLGVFVGHNHEQAYWTLKDSGRQSSVCTFENAEVALEFALSSFEMPAEHKAALITVNITPTGPKGEFATPIDLQTAGLSAYLGDLDGPRATFH